MEQIQNEGKKRSRLPAFFRFHALAEALRVFLMPYLCCILIVLCVLVQNHTSGASGGMAFAGIRALFLGEALYQSLWLLFFLSFAVSCACRRFFVPRLWQCVCYAACVPASVCCGVLLSRFSGGLVAARLEAVKAMLQPALLLLGLVLLSRGDGRAHARFVVRAALYAMLGAFMVTIVFFGGLFLFSVYDMLLGDAFRSAFWLTGDLAALLYGAVLPLLLMPHLLAQDEPPAYPGALRGFVTYAILPLFALLAIVFYLYLGRILISRQWPSNEVSPLVLFGSAVGVLGLFFYGAIPEDPASKLYFRVFPIAWILPLSMLFIAAGMRIAAYGPTPARVLVAAVAVWILGVLIYAFFARKFFSPRILCLSFALLLLVCALCPGVNLFSVSRTGQVLRLGRALKDADMGTRTAVVQNADAPEETRRIVLSAADYLHHATTVKIRAADGTEFDGTNCEEVFGFSRDESADGADDRPDFSQRD